MKIRFTKRCVRIIRKLESPEGELNVSSLDIHYNPLRFIASWIDCFANWWMLKRRGHIK